MSEDLGALLPYFPEHPTHGIKTYIIHLSGNDSTQMQDIALTLVKVLKGRSERKTHKVMARGVEQIATVRRVDVKEDTRDDDSLFLE
jgi:hypothetical protein